MAKSAKRDLTKNKDAFFGLWSVGFLCCVVNICVLMSSAWLVSNRKESMALAIGNTYWKGVFAQCMSRGHRHFHCDNYEVPWFLFDSVVLSVRSLMVLAMVFIVFAQFSGVISGNFSHIMSGLSVKSRYWITVVTGSLYFLAGFFLLFTSALFTVTIMHQYEYDGRYGPLNGHEIKKRIEENGVRYEFGPCLYLGYVFGFIEMVIGAVHFCINPFTGHDKDDDGVDTSEFDYLGQPEYY